MNGEYDLRPTGIEPSGITAATRLLQQVFPGAAHFTEPVVKWQYANNPDGTVVGFNAWHHGVLAAHYVTIPLLARIDGREEKGLLSLNTATHPGHQGKGLFTKLANATYDEGARQGFGFVIGVANANSTHGFTKKLGFQPVSPLCAMIGVGRLPLATVEHAGYERIWHEAALRWRLSHPAYRYRLKRTKAHDLILTDRVQFGARHVLAAMPARSVPDAVIQPFTGSAPFKLWIGLDAAMRWRGRPYLNIPMRLRPSPLNLIFKDLTGKGRTLDPTTVRFQAIDFDVL